jgi:hypothetical protein
VWYCVTLIVGGGIDVMMACWDAWRLLDSFLSPPIALKELPFSDQRAYIVVSRPVVWEGFDE